MGMFDTFFCEYFLPEINLEGTSLTQKIIQYQDYQTKDLENILQEYTIEKDGRISYIEYKSRKWVEDSNYPGLKGYVEQTEPETKYLRGNYCITIGAFLPWDNDENDYSWDWRVTILDGVVKEISLESFKKIPNAERKLFNKQLKEKFRAREKFVRTLQYKYFWKWVEQTLHFLRRRLIKFMNFLTNLIYKL